MKKIKKQQKGKDTLPRLILAKGIFALRTQYATLARLLKKKSGAEVRSITVFQIRKRNDSNTLREMRALRQLCRTYWHLIYQPYNMSDAVPETRANNL